MSLSSLYRWNGVSGVPHNVTGVSWLAGLTPDKPWILQPCSTTTECRKQTWRRLPKEIRTWSTLVFVFLRSHECTNIKQFPQKISHQKKWLTYWLLFLNIYRIEVQLIYSVVLISAVQWSDAIIRISTFFSSFPSWFMTVSSTVSCAIQ